MLTLKRYPKRSPNWYVRGTVAGLSLFESTGTADRHDAEEFLRQRDRELYQRGALGREAPASFADAVNAYLDHGRPGRFLTPLLDHFRERPLAAIGQAEVDRAAQALYPGRKASTLVRQVYGPVIAVLNHAADAGLEGAMRRRIRMPKVGRPPAQWASDAQVAALLPHLNPRLRALVLVMTYTGLRISECLRLRRPDVTLRPAWLLIGRTKNGEPAFVPLPPQAVEALAAVLPEGLEPAFGYVTVQGVNKALKAAAGRAKVPYLSTHRIGRHTFAARLLAEGYDIKLLKEAGRWKTLHIVDETYGHLEQRHAHDAMLAVANRAKSVQ